MFDKVLTGDSVHQNRDAIVVPGRTVTWGGLRDEVARTQVALSGFTRQRIGVRFDGTAEGCAVLAALAAHQSDVFLFDSAAPLNDSVKLASALRIVNVLSPRLGQVPDVTAVERSDNANWSGQATVTILTSGSTGKPKAVRHTWASLLRPVRKTPETAAPRWFLTYRPHLYAGVQVMLQCLSNQGTLLVPGDYSDVNSIAQLMIAGKVQFVSATPSYLRRLLLFCDEAMLRRVCLLHVTLGGEVVNQDILDALRRAFPHARLVHIYATTELGRCFSVTDGQAGFPLRYLDHPSADGVELRIQDGELLVRSANAMQCYDPYSSSTAAPEQWFPTGDLVKTMGDRVYFVGRRSDLINVGGQKVSPLEVERVIRAVSGVLDVRVYGKRSSVVGQVVACELVTVAGHDAEPLIQAVKQHCRIHLTSAQQPRLVHVIPAINLSPAGKTIRNEKP